MPLAGSMETAKVIENNDLATKERVMRLSDIDLRLLRVFKAVADSGGFVKAQAGLGISQPAISSHIANLEQRLGVRLCNRGPQGFSLTGLGKEVLDETNQLLDHLDAYANKLNEIGKTPSALVRVGVVDCLITDPKNPLPKVIRAAKTIFDDLRVRVGVYDYLDCLTELRSGRLDVAIIGIGLNEALPNDVETVHIYDELSGLFVTPDHPAAQKGDKRPFIERLKECEIAAHSFLSNPLDESLELHLLDANAEISQGNIETTTYLTLAGTHVGLIPIHYANQWVKSGELIQVAPETHSVVSEFHIARLKTVDASTAAKYIWEEFLAAKNCDII